MSYQDFDLNRAQSDFGLTVSAVRPLFAGVAPVAISEGLRLFWANTQPLGMLWVTEKGRSELLAAPLLSEVWHRSGREVGLLSGVTFTVDDAAGLNGVCDFLLCRSLNPYTVRAPVLVAVEAKRDLIYNGLGQCAATMVAALRFNAREGEPAGPVYGCVTTGANWKFLRLDGTALDIDGDEYPVAQADRILGILLHCCGVAV